MAGPEPAKLQEAFGEKAGAAASSNPAHASAGPRLCPPQTGDSLFRRHLWTWKGRGREAEGKKSILPHRFPSIPQWSVGNLLCLMSKSCLMWRQKCQWDEKASCYGRPRGPTKVCTAWQGSLCWRKERLSPSIRVICPCIWAELSVFPVSVTSIVVVELYSHPILQVKGLRLRVKGLEVGDSYISKFLVSKYFSTCVLFFKGVWGQLRDINDTKPYIERWKWTMWGEST